MRAPRCQYWTALLLVAVACVRTPESQVTERWVTLTPGGGADVLFPERDGPLAGVSFKAGVDAVSTTTELKFDVPLRGDFAFVQAGGGFEAHTPVVQIAPAGVRLDGDARLVLPWVGLDDDVDETLVRVLRTDGPDAVPLGLWEPVSDVTIRADRIEIRLERTGIYWAGHWRADILSQPVTTFADPCLETISGLEACTVDDECVVSGCFAEVCGAEPVTTTCRPSSAITARRGCACRCSARLCQWIR